MQITSPERGASRSQARRTDCPRVAPPATASSAGRRSAAASSTRSAGTAITIFSKFTLRSASSARASSGRPPSGTKAFGSGRPRRGPEPPAGTMASQTMAPSDREDLFFFRLQQLVDFRDLAVGDLLRLVQPASLVVLGDCLVLEHLLQPVIALVAKPSNLDPRLLGHVVRLLGEVLAAVLGLGGGGG